MNRETWALMTMYYRIYWESARMWTGMVEIPFRSLGVL